MPYSLSTNTMSNRDSGASHFESRMDDPDYLRNLIREKPRNAKLMATLACVLANQETRHSFDSSIGGESPTATDKKAIYWAEKSIETAPQKPFGYSVLSKIHKDFGVRMDNLQKAIDRTDNQDSFLVARIDMLIQLLELPRKRKRKSAPASSDSSNGKSRVFLFPRSFILREADSDNGKRLLPHRHGHRRFPTFRA